MSRPRFPLVVVAALIVWLPMFAPLAMDDWFQLDAYREQWLRSVWFQPGRLFAMIALAPWDHVGNELSRAIALLFAIVLCALLVFLMHRSPRKRWWIASGAAAVSLLYAFALCWASTHG